MNAEIIEWTPKNELIFLMKNQVHCYITGNSNTFYLFFIPSRTNIPVRLFGSYCSVHELSHLKWLYFVLLVMFLICFFSWLFAFFFFPLVFFNTEHCWLVGSLKGHTSLFRNPWGTRGGGSMKIVKGFILRPLVMVLITKQRLSQLTLNYCSLFMLNKRNMT